MGGFSSKLAKKNSISETPKKPDNQTGQETAAKVPESPKEKEVQNLETSKQNDAKDNKAETIKAEISPEKEPEAPKTEVIAEKEPEVIAETLKNEISPVEETEAPKIEAVAEKETEAPKTEDIAEKETEAPKTEIIAENEAETHKTEVIAEKESTIPAAQEAGAPQSEELLTKLDEEVHKVEDASPETKELVEKIEEKQAEVEATIPTPEPPKIEENSHEEQTREEVENIEISKDEEISQDYQEAIKDEEEEPKLPVCMNIEPEVEKIVNEESQEVPQDNNEPLTTKIQEMTEQLSQMEVPSKEEVENTLEEKVLNVVNGNSITEDAEPEKNHLSEAEDDQSPLPEPPKMEELKETCTNGLVDENMNLAKGLVRRVSLDAAKRLNLQNLVKKYLIEDCSVEEEEKADHLADKFIENLDCSVDSISGCIGDLCNELGVSAENDASQDLKKSLESHLMEINMAA